MWEIIEFSIYVILVIIGITQVVIPAFSTRLPFFWLFRQTSIKKVIKAKEKLTEAELEKKAREIKDKAFETEFGEYMGEDNPSENSLEGGEQCIRPEEKIKE